MGKDLYILTRKVRNSELNSQEAVLRNERKQTKLHCAKGAGSNQARRSEQRKKRNQARRSEQRKVRNSELSSQKAAVRNERKQTKLHCAKGASSNQARRSE